MILQCISIRSTSATGLHTVLQTIQMKVIIWCVWAEQVVLGNAKTALEFKYVPHRKFSFFFQWVAYIKYEWFLQELEMACVFAIKISIYIVCSGSYPNYFINLQLKMNSEQLVIVNNFTKTIANFECNMIVFSINVILKKKDFKDRK